MKCKWRFYNVYGRVRENKKKKTFDQHKSRLTEFETAVFFRRRRPRPERFGCGVPAAAAHPLKCSSGLPSSPPPPMRVYGRMRWWGMRKVARWNGHRGARSTVVSSEFVSRQTVGRSSRCAAHVNTPPTDCHVFNNVTSIVFSVRQSFPGVFFSPPSGTCSPTRHEVQLVTRVRGVRRRGRNGVRGQPTATVQPGGDAAQRSENRIRVHVGRMRAQVQDQRHAHHALHRKTGGRHQVRL